MKVSSKIRKIDRKSGVIIIVNRYFGMIKFIGEFYVYCRSYLDIYEVTTEKYVVWGRTRTLGTYYMYV